MKQISYLAGLPRSGSTLLSNVLAMHPKIYSTPSSPLCGIVQNMRRHWSDDSFFLSQLDSNFPIVHERIKRSTWAFMQAWSSDTEDPIVLDKNRGWLFCLEWLRELDPDFKMIITLRDLRDVYASVEKRHRQTLFVDFPDHMEHNIVDQRANALFSDGGIVGSILKGLQNIRDIPDIVQHVYYWRFEDFLNNPQETANHVFNFLGLEAHEIDFNNIIQSTWESDSFHRMKYRHRIYGQLQSPPTHRDIPISPRIIRQIENQFEWYFKDFYADFINAPQQPRIPEVNHSGPQSIQSSSSPMQATQANPSNPDDEKMIAELEAAIKEETDGMQQK